MRRNQLYAVLGIATCLSVCSSGYAIHKAEPDPKVESDPKYKKLFVYTCAALIKSLPGKRPTENWRPEIRNYIEKRFEDAKFEKAFLSKKERNDVLYHNDTYSDELFLQKFATLLKKTAEEIDPDLLSKAIPTGFNRKVRKATEVIFNEVKRGNLMLEGRIFVPQELLHDESYILSVRCIFFEMGSRIRTQHILLEMHLKLISEYKQIRKFGCSDVEVMEKLRKRSSSLRSICAAMKTVSRKDNSTESEFWFLYDQLLNPRLRETIMKKLSTVISWLDSAITDWYCDSNYWRSCSISKEEGEKILKEIE